MDKKNCSYIAISIIMQTSTTIQAVSVQVKMVAQRGGQQNAVLTCLGSGSHVPGLGNRHDRGVSASGRNIRTAVDGADKRRTRTRLWPVLHLQHDPATLFKQRCHIPPAPSRQGVGKLWAGGHMRLVELLLIPSGRLEEMILK